MPDTVATVVAEIESDIINEIGEEAITPPIHGGLLKRVALLVDERLLKGGNTDGADVVAGTTDAHSFGINTNNTRRMTVTSAGRVLIKTVTEDVYDIDVNGTARFSGRSNIGSLAQNTKSPFLQVAGANLSLSDTSDISASGAVGIRTTTSNSNDGGAIVFGSAAGIFAAIKSAMVSGASNTNGSIGIYVRQNTTDAGLTLGLNISTAGVVSVSSLTSSNNINAGGGRLPMEKIGSWGATGEGWRYESGAYKAVNTQAATKIDYTNGNFSFQTAPQVSAGSNLTFTSRMVIDNSTGYVRLLSVPTYADNTAATGAGLAVGTVYKTSTGDLKIVY